MVPRVSDFDGMCEFALNFLLTGEGDARCLAATLARHLPELPALELIFVLATTASGLESVFSGEEMVAIAQDAWRVSALVGVDLHLMQVIGMPHDHCADLVHYWQAEDRFFLI